MLGFILTRHVRSKETNILWMHAVQKIRFSYPKSIIVVIDDDSDYTFVTEALPVDNCIVVRSEFRKRGELLPYYYLYKHKWFPKAVILHDSVFVHEKVKGFDLANVPLWHFDGNIRASYTIEQAMLSKLNNNEKLLEVHESKQYLGMFGVMSVVTLSFVNMLQEKYNLFVLLDDVTDRERRMCLERVMGILFTVEKQANVPSIFGSIHRYCRWGINFTEYLHTKTQRPVTKVWSGR